MADLEKDDLNEVRQLLSSGADLNSPGRNITLAQLPSQVPSYPLIRAVIDNNLEAVRLLLESGANPNICCEYVHDSRACWFYPLCYASHPDIVSMLLDAGAEANALQRPAYYTETVLLRSVYFQPSIAEFLIERGDDVNVTDETGCTALYHAICQEYHDIAALLVQVRWGNKLFKN